MVRFGLRFKKKRSQPNLPADVGISGAPLEAVPEDEVSGSSLFSQSHDETEISSTSSMASSSSIHAAPASDTSYQYQPSTAAVGRHFDQRSFESSVDTLIVNDTASTVNTLLDMPSPSLDGSRQPRGSAGLSKVLPIYATRFRSGVQVFESDIAATVFRTVARSKNKQDDSQHQTSAGTGTSQIPLPPALACQTTSTINPFSKKPFMTITRHGKTLRNPALSSNRPFTLLAEEVHQRQVDLGLLRTAPSNQPTSSSDGTSLHPHPAALHTAGTSVTEETGNKPFCTVWQDVVGPDQIKYTLELDEAEFGQPRIVMLNDGRRRVTKTSYGGVRLQWDGTTGIGSPFGSGYFELRFSDDIISPISGAAHAEQQQPQQHRRPPVAVYHNVGTKTLAATRKVGEFVVWEPGFEFADLIVAMGLVLREQEQRKEIESHSVPINKLGNLR
jgi:hypothetical protein